MKAYNKYMNKKIKLNHNHRFFSFVLDFSSDEIEVKTVKKKKYLSPIILYLLTNEGRQKRNSRLYFLLSIHSPITEDVKSNSCHRKKRKETIEEGATDHDFSLVEIYS